MNRYLSILSCLLIVASCSKGGGDKAAVNQETHTLEPLETEFKGTYQALLSPLNKAVSGHVNGSLTIVKEDDNFLADVRFSGGPASILHTQNIHVGARCPNENDDLNKDGFVDAEEAAKIYGKILIPLDDDLSSQWIGLGTFPVTDEYGYYFWTRSASYTKMMDDLLEEDINLEDDYLKLTNEKNISMTNKVVVILGVPQDTPLPETVSGRGRMLNYQALPVACGVIRKLNSVPGTIDNDETGIPLPEGETIGGSSGADDGAIFTPTEDGSTSGGDYGSEEEPEVRDNSTEFGNTTGGSF